MILITFAICTFTWAAVFSAMMLLMPWIGLPRFKYQQQQAIASLAGTLMMARSPASAVSKILTTESPGSQYPQNSLSVFCSLHAFSRETSPGNHIP